MHHSEDLLHAQWLGEYRHPELPRGLWVGSGMRYFPIFVSTRRVCFLSFGKTLWTIITKVG